MARTLLRFCRFLTRRSVLALAAALVVPVLTGGDTPAVAGPNSWPKTFVIEYFWGSPTLPPEPGPTGTLRLYRNGTFTAVDDLTGDTGTGTWATRRGGQEIVFRIGGVNLEYVGVRVAPGEYEGTMGIPGGPSGVWRGGYIP